MASRKWLVRSLYVGFLAALAIGGFVVYSWMRPEFIRSELIRLVSGKFNNVDVEVRSAHLRLLGGISVADLKLIRSDDPTRTPFLYVPSAILHHDKEKLNSGKLVIRKVEMLRPRLQIERDANGKWNLTDLLKPRRDDEPAPIFVLREATIVFIDRQYGDQPLLELTDVSAKIVNDPAPVIAFDLKGTGRPLGSFHIHGRFDKRSGLTLTLDLPDIAVGAELARLIEIIAPDEAEYAKPLTGKASVHLDAVWQNGATPVLYHDLRVQLHNGRFAHENLPVALEQIEASFRSKNGDLALENFSARVGSGSISVSLELPKEPPCAPGTTPLQTPGIGPTERGPLQELEDRLRFLNVGVTNLSVTPDLFAKIPGKGALIRDMLMPSGPLSMTYTFRRQEGAWKKQLVIQPGGMDVKYRGFPYQVRNVRGTVVHTATDSSSDRIQIDLTGEGAGTSVALTGTITGSAPEHEVDLRLAGNGVVLDQELIDSLPDDNPAMLRKLHATARGDFVAQIRHNARIRREYGPEVFDNLFTITVRQGSMTCEAFPFRLEELTGTLLVRTVPERPAQLPASAGQPPKTTDSGGTATLEFKDFKATHNGAKITGHGQKVPTSGGSFLSLSIDAQSLALDEDVHKALAAIRMENSWTTLAPSGAINCAIRVRLFTKSDPAAELYAPEDLELAMAFAGGSARPKFFPYQLHDVAGRVGYAKGRVEIKELRARHDNSAVTLPFGEILFRPSGGYWADLRDLRINPLVIDGDFLAALAPGLRSACEGLELKGPMALHATRMVIDEKPGPYMPNYLPSAARGAAPADPEPVATVKAPALKQLLPTIYWDGTLTLAGASLKTGVDWQEVHGTFASWGLYKGDRLGAVRGNLAVDKAVIAKQPVEAVTAQVRVDPRQPDVLQVPSIRGKLYNGDVGGEAWIVLDSPARYALRLDAARVRLEDLARHYKLPPKSRLEGFASAQLYLSNRPDEQTGQLVVQGSGSIDVPRGKLLNLPVLLNLIKLAKLRVPDDTGFEEAHALFYIRGERVRFGQLDLVGNAISLAGEGEMNTNGANVHFEFYPVWTKLKEMFALPGDWSGALSKKFLKIRVTGELDGTLDYKPEPVPGLVDPVKRVLQRLTSKN
jgi:hypothetical protein